MSPSHRESNLRHEATHDALTGALNRRGLSEKLGTLIERQPGNFALGLIDLDGLKIVNDTEGDAQLQRACEAIQRIIRQDPRNDGPPDALSHDTTQRTARSGGDEFIVLLPGITNDEDLAATLARIQTGLDEEGIEASIGGTVHRPGMDKTRLIEHSDTSMYENKVQRKLEKYSPEQLNRINSIGAIAAEHAIDLRDVPMLLPHLDD